MIALLSFLLKSYRSATWVALATLLFPCLAFAQEHTPAPIPFLLDEDRLAILFFGLLIGIVLAAATYLFFIWLAIGLVIYFSIALVFLRGTLL